MACLPLDDIAAAIHDHFMNGTLDVDYLNSLLFPATRILIATNELTFTPPDPSAGRSLLEERGDQAEERIENDGKEARDETEVEEKHRTEGAAAVLHTGHQPVTRNMVATLDPTKHQHPETAIEPLPEDGSLGMQLRPNRPNITACLGSTPHVQRKRKHGQIGKAIGPGTPSVTRAQAGEGGSNKDLLRDAPSIDETTEETTKDEKNTTGLPLNERRPSRSVKKPKQLRMAVAEGWKPEEVAAAQEDFLARWTTRGIKVLGAWPRLDELAKIGEYRRQRPFEALDTIVHRVLQFGSSALLEAFRKAVQNWTSRREKSGEFQIPDHLRVIEGLDAAPFQRFWRAMATANTAEHTELIAVLLRRRALADLSAAFEEVVVHIRAAIKDGRIKLKSGQKAAAKAREIVYEVVYPNEEDRGRMRAKFQYTYRCAYPYRCLCQHFGNDGILAMIPTRINETLWAQPSDIAPMIALLDLIHPHFHDGHLLSNLSAVIKQIAGNRYIDQKTLDDLDDQFKMLRSNDDKV